MKKIFTLFVLSAATISFAAAQSYNQKDAGFKDDKRVSDVRNGFDKDKGYNESYFAYKQQIERVNREFDQKIADVKHSWRMSGREKERQIKFLQMQRQRELDKLQYEFEKGNQKYKGKEHGHDYRW